MRERGLENDPTLAVYFPATGTSSTSLQIALHTRNDPERTVAAIRTVVGSVDSTLPISNIRTMEDLVNTSVATRRMTMLLVVTFAVLALTLALAGVYGVLAYSVARRTPEMGVRLALGARPRRLLLLVMAQGMRPVIVGALLGVAGAFWVSRFLSTLLFNITPHDAATYLGIIGILLGVSLLACYIPARRVLRVDPAEALRVE